MASIKDTVNAATTGFLQKYKTPLLIGGGVLGILAGAFLWNHFHQVKSEEPPAAVYETNEESHSVDGVDKAAEQSGVHLDLGQQKEILQSIIDSDTQKPDSVVQTTGAQLASAVKTEQVRSGADFTIVSPAKSGDTTASQLTGKSGQLPTIPANTPVTLNQYNIKAYPDRLLEMSVYGDGSADIAYETKVKFLGVQGYVGPVVKYDPNKTNKATVGARLTVPF